MNLPDIYRQPVDGLRNFEMNGDSLAIVKDCTNRINRQENDLNGNLAKESPVKAATHTESNS